MCIYIIINLDLVRLPAADSRLVLDLGVGNRLATEGHDQGFTSLGTLFKLLGLAGRSVKTDELDHLAPKAFGPGLFRFALADLGASLDLLDGNANLVVPLLNNVLADQGSRQLRNWGQLLNQTFQRSGDDGFLDALVQFAFVLGPQLAGDALARGLGDHVAEGGQAGLGHQALPGGLEVSSVLVVEVTAKTAGTSLEHLRGRDLDPLSIEKDPEGFLREDDKVDVVLVPLDLHDDLLGTFGAGNDLFNLTGLDEELTLLSFNVQLELQILPGGNVGGHQELGDTGQDLDLLLLRVQDVLGQDSDGDLLSAVLEEQVEAVVQLVAVGLVIEGPDVLGFDAARGGDLVTGELLQDVEADGVPQGHGEDTLQEVGNADVADLVLGSSDFSLELGLFSGTGHIGAQFQNLLGGVGRVFNPHLGNEEGLQSLTNPVEDGVTGNGPGQSQFSLHLIDGSGLVAGEFANRSQNLAGLFLHGAPQVLGGPPDGLLLGLSLGHLAGHPDGFLGLVLVSVLNLTVQDQPQNLIENLFLGPPVVDTGDLRPGGQLDLVGLAVPGGPDLDVGDQLDNLGRAGRRLFLLHANGESGLGFVVGNALFGPQLGTEDNRDNGARFQLLHGLVERLDVQETLEASLGLPAALSAGVVFLAQVDGVPADLLVPLATIEGSNAAHLGNGLLNGLKGAELEDAAGVALGVSGVDRLADLLDVVHVSDLSLGGLGLADHEAGHALDLQGAGGLLALGHLHQGQAQGNFLGLGLTGVEDDPGGGHADGGGQVVSVQEGHQVMLLDHGDVRHQIVVLGIRLVLDLAGHGDQLANGNISLLQGGAGEDGLHGGLLGRRPDHLQVLLDGVGGDEHVDGLNLVTLRHFFGQLDVQRQLAGLLRQGHFQGGSNVDGGLNTDGNQFLSEGRNNTPEGLNLDVDDGDNLALQHLGDPKAEAFFHGHLTVALEGHDNGDLNGVVDGETSIGGTVAFSLQKLQGPDIGEGLALKHVAVVILEFLFDLFQGLNEFSLGQVPFIFHLHELALHEDNGFLLDPLFNVQLLDDLGELFGDLAASLEGLAVVPEEASDPLVHTFSVDGPVGSNDLKSATVNHRVDVLPDGHHLVLGLDIRPLLGDGQVQVLDKVSNVDVLGELDTKLEGLDKGQQRPDLLSNDLKFGHLSDGQRLEGGVDEAGDLLGGFQPGPDGDLLQFSGGGLSEGQDGNSGDPDFTFFSSVVNDGQQDGLDVDGLHPGGPLHGVDSQGPDHGFELLVGHDLGGQDLDGFQGSGLAQSGDDVQLDAHVLFSLKLLFKEGQVLLNHAGIGLAEVTIHVDGERDRLGPVNASLVHGVGQTEKGNVVDIHPFLTVRLLLQGFLDQRDQLPHQFLGGGLDVLEGGLNQPQSHLGFDPGGRHPKALLDQHDSGIGTDHGNNIVEQALQDLLLFLRGPGLNPGCDIRFDFLQLLEAQSSQVLGNIGQATSNVQLGGARVIVKDFLGNLGQFFKHLLLDLMNAQVDLGEPVGGRPEVGLLQLGLDSSLKLNLLLLLNGQVTFLSGFRDLKDQSLELLGGGGGNEGSERLLGFQEFHGDPGGVAHGLLGLPAHSSSADGVLSDGFPDDDVTDIITASNVVGGRDVL